MLKHCTGLSFKCFLIIFAYVPVQFDTRHCRCKKPLWSIMLPFFSFFLPYERSHLYFLFFLVELWVEGTGGDCDTACQGAGASAMTNEVHTNGKPIYPCAGLTGLDYRPGWNVKDGVQCYHRDGDANTFYCLCQEFSSTYQLVSSGPGERCTDTCSGSGKYPVVVSSHPITGAVYDTKQYSICYGFTEGKTLPGWQLYECYTGCADRQVDGGNAVLPSKDCLCRTSLFFIVSVLCVGRP